MSKKNCERCNSEFTYKYINARVCKKCKGKTAINNCNTCGKQFYYDPYEVGKYCSRACTKFAEYKETNCFQCKKTFTYKVWDQRGKYCSVPCKQLGSRLTTEQKQANVKTYFEKHIVKKEGCWEWTGGISSNGYGMIGAGASGKINAHRASWMIHNGPIPKGMHVCHSCDNRLCNNPKHLFLGTHEDNMQDCLNKGRMRGHFKPGIIAHNKKTNNEQEREIKKFIGKMKRKDLCEKFGLKLDVIKRIISEFKKETS